MTRVKQM